MKEIWKPKLKHYPHFDAPLRHSEIIPLVTNPKRVAQNAFFPFLLYYDVTQKFRPNKAKKRPIRYASRRDSYIFSYYRNILSQEYEALLKQEGLTEHIIAYRKIPEHQNSQGGKCNIHFARDAFTEISKQGDCYAVALDIKDYFNKIDHDKLEILWRELMGFNQLPPDHKAVFKNVTKHRWVDFDRACEILGYKGNIEINGVKKFGFKRDIPRNSFFKDKKYKQLCSVKIFREKIAPEIKQNQEGCGIPQGSPISDVLANLFLLPFDRTLHKYCNENSIYYRRYSDDILLIIPKNKNLLHKTINLAKKELHRTGSQLEIKEEKTIIKEFIVKNEGLECKPHTLRTINKEDQHKGSNFEYLGFSFDGKIVRIKDGTLHRFQRKMFFAARREAIRLVIQHGNKTPEEIIKLAKFDLLYKRYGNVEAYDDLDFSKLSDKKKLTFIVYAKKADEIFYNFKSCISEQISGHKKLLRTMLDKAIVTQWEKQKQTS